MAVKETFVSASLRLKNYDKKPAGSYSGINPNVDPEMINSFADCVSTLQTQNVEYKTLVVESLLEENA